MSKKKKVKIVHVNKYESKKGQLKQSSIDNQRNDKRGRQSFREELKVELMASCGRGCSGYSQSWKIGCCHKQRGGQCGIINTLVSRRLETMDMELV